MGAHEDSPPQTEQAPDQQEQTPSPPSKQQEQELKEEVHEHKETPPTNGEAVTDPAPAPAAEDGNSQEQQPPPQEAQDKEGRDGVRGGKEDRKIFVGGIAYDVAHEDLVSHFSQYGEVSQAQVKYDRVTQRSRGFAFVEFATPEACKEALQHREHLIKNKQCEIKPAKSRENNKVFVGGLPSDFPEDELRKHFEEYGKVEDIEWPYYKQTKARRNFAFIVFEEEEAADRAASVPRQTFGSREADVKKAVTQNKRNFLFGVMGGPVGPPRGLHLGAIRAYGAGGMRGGPYTGLHHSSNAQWFGGSIASAWPSLTAGMQYGAAGGGSTGWGDWYGGGAGAGSYYAATHHHQGGHSAAGYGTYASSNGFGHFDPHQIGGRPQHSVGGHQPYGSSRHSQNGSLTGGGSGVGNGNGGGGNGSVGRFQAQPQQQF